jgi:putative membrane protein
MLHGFLPYSRSGFMMDLVVVAMAVVLPILTWSLYLVRVKKQYEKHAKIQLFLATSLLLVVVLFEIDVRLNGWVQFAKISSYYNTWLFPVMWFHLVIAVSTTLLWGVTVWTAIKNFPTPARPNGFSGFHKKIAMTAAIGMYMTASTGWIFYYMAFVA